MVDAIALTSVRQFDDGVEKHVVLTLDTIINGESIKYTMLDLLSGAEKLGEIFKDYPLIIDELFGLPVIVIDTSVFAKQKQEIIAYGLQNIEAALHSGRISKEKLQIQLPESRKRHCPRATVSHINLFLDFLAGDLKLYYDKKLSVKISFRGPLCNQNKIQQVKRAIEEMNLSTSMSAEYVSVGQNIATKQNVPTDRFFIPLPVYEEFKSDSIKSNPIPDLGTIFTPFSHKAYYSPLWKLLVGKPESARLKIFTEENRRKVGLKFSKSDISSWVDYPREHIEGNSENDELPIMDNEKEWYEAFIRFMRTDLIKSQGEERGQKMFDSGALTPEMEDYFDKVLDEILLLNWSCSGRFKISAFTGVESDDDDESNDDEYESAEQNLIMESLYYINTNPNGFDGLEAIRSHIKHVARGNSTTPGTGCKTYAEAIIKLARWGERRPASLKLDGEALFFNLTTFSTQSKIINFDKMEEKKINGRSLSFIGLTNLTWVLQDASYCMKYGISGKMTNTPVGVIAVRSFEGEQEFQQIVYISMLDVIAEYRKGNQFIDGIDLMPDGKFSVRMGADGYFEDLYSAIKEIRNNPYYTIYTPKSLVNFARETQQRAQELTDLMLLLKYSDSTNGAVTVWFSRNIKLENKKDLARVVTEEGVPVTRAVSMRILEHILPLYFKYSDELKKHEFDDDWDADSYFNIFCKIAEDLSITNSTEFFNIDESYNPVTSTVSKLEKFGAVVTKEETAEVRGQAKDVAAESSGGTEETTGSRSVEQKGKDEFEELLNSYVARDVTGIKVVRPVIFRVRDSGSGEFVKKILAYYGETVLRNVNGKANGVGVLFAKTELPAGVITQSVATEYSAFTIPLLNILAGVFSRVNPGNKTIMFASRTTAMHILSLYTKGE